MAACSKVGRLSSLWSAKAENEQQSAKRTLEHLDRQRQTGLEILMVQGIKDLKEFIPNLVNDIRDRSHRIDTTGNLS